MAFETDKAKQALFYQEESEEQTKIVEQLITFIQNTGWYGIDWDKIPLLKDKKRAALIGLENMDSVQKGLCGAEGFHGSRGLIGCLPEKAMDRVVEGLSADPFLQADARLARHKRLMELKQKK